MSVRGGKRAPKQAAEVRRETVLDAAIRVFGRTSYRAAGTAEIAREAGIAEPTIYRYFDSKRDLYLAALERCGTIIRDTFRHLADTHPDGAEALKAMGSWYREARETDPDHLRLRQRAIAETDDEDVQALMRRIYGEVREIAAEVIERGQQQGSFRPDMRPEAGAWMFIAVGHTLDLARLIGMSSDEYTIGCEQMVDLAFGSMFSTPA
jgi:AcrR family transcriptional regulator